MNQSLSTLHKLAMKPQVQADLNAITLRANAASRLGLGLSEENEFATPPVFDDAYSLYEGVTVLVNRGIHKLEQSTEVVLSGQDLLHVSFVLKGAKYWQDSSNFAKLNGIYVKSLHKEQPESYCLGAGSHLSFSLVISEKGIENLIKINGLTLNTGATLLKLIGAKDRCAQEFYTSIESKSFTAKLFGLLQQERPNTLWLNASMYALCEALLNDIAKGMTTTTEVNKHTSLDILSCKDLIDNASDLALNTNDLAHMYDVSEATLNRHFKNVFGETISSYLKRVRFDYAKRQLLEKDTPLATLAVKLGYSDMASFSRAFKKHFGVPPSQINGSNSDPEPL